MSSSSSNPRQHAYGVGSPSIRITPPPIVSTRAPTPSDWRYPTGQQWVYQISATNANIYSLGAVQAQQPPTTFQPTAEWVILGGSGGAVATLTGNTGGAISPSAGNINTLGTGSITIAGSGSTLTTQLTGLTNHAILAGAGTATITNIGPNSATGLALISQGSSADPIFGTVLVPGGGSGAATFTAHGVLLGEGTSAFGVTAAGATGQVFTGVTGADPVWTNLPAFNFVDVTGTSQAVAVNTTYIADNAGLVTFTLPATAAQGSTFSIVGNGAGGWTVAQNASQAIKLNANTTTTGTGGSMSSTNHYNSAVFYATVGGASTIWVVKDFSGSFTFV